MPANITCERHNDDLFEEGNCGHAHLYHARVETSRARLRESHQLLLRVTLVGFIGLIVDRLAEVHSVSMNFWIVAVLFSYVALSIGFGLHPLLNRLYFVQKRFLFLGRLLDSFALWATLCGLSLGCLGLYLGSLLSILVSRNLGFINIIAHGLIIFNRARERLMDAGDVRVWRVWILDKAVARRVNHFEVEGKVAPFSQGLQPHDKLVDLLGNLRIVLAALRLQFTNAFNGCQQETLHSLNGALLCLWWDLEVELRNSDCCEL